MAYAIYQPNALDRSEFAGTRSGTWEPAADERFETIEEARAALAILQEQGFGTLAIMDWDDSRYPIEIVADDNEPSDDSDDFVECAYCSREVSADDNELVPASDDDAEWERLAAMHAEWCEWITTRAHRLLAQG